MMRILFISSDEGFKQAFEKVLKKKNEDSELTFFVTAQGAFRELEVNPFHYDLAVVDYQLPDMNGLECCKKLKALNDSLPFVILAEKKMEDLSVGVKQVGADAFVIKEENENYFHLLMLYLMKVIAHFKACRVCRSLGQQIAPPDPKSEGGDHLKNRNLESIGILAGGIARDFNNYLTSIMGNISIAKLSMHDAEKINRALNRAEDISIKAADLAGKLLTFSEGGHPIYTSVSVPSLIKEVIRADFSKTAIKFDFQKKNNIWPMLGDETQLHQLISSIIHNSAESMPNGGTVTIETQNVTLPSDNRLELEEGNYILISIHDSGTGIPRENMEKIFDPFFSTKDPLKENGIGLGLSICLSIIKKHRGHIAIDSAVGKGTTVSLHIPAFKEEAAEFGF
ncbi:MAG: ATP-binding protein [Candidatus Omnitrophota bacterium]